MSSNSEHADERTPLVRSAKPGNLSVLDAVHFVLFVMPAIVVGATTGAIWSYVVRRKSSPAVALGRPFFSDIVARAIRGVFTWLSFSQFRWFCDSAYLIFLTPTANRKWVRNETIRGTVCRWVSPPGEGNHEKDDMILFWVHGGAFIGDVGAFSIAFFVDLTRKMRARGVRFSILFADYDYAQDTAYPSQLIQITRSYHHLVNDLGIPEHRIVFGGDSAGGNLIASLLLHLARPNPAVQLERSAGPTPKRPSAALFVSPWINLTSAAAATTQNRDIDILATPYLEECAVAYGAPSKSVQATASWNPFRLFKEAPARLEAFIADPSTDESLQLLNLPYVNPAMCRDAEWWREALPSEGRTFVAWDSKEIFGADCEAFVKTLENAGVAPKTFQTHQGMHTWPIINVSLAWAFPADVVSPQDTLTAFFEDLAMDLGHKLEAV